MFGSRGPRSRDGRKARPEGTTAPRGGVLETLIVQGPSGGRAAGGDRGERRVPARERRAGVVAPAKPRLVDLASDWLSTVLALAQVAEFPDARALRARALELKGRFEREAAEQGFAAADVDDALFAMVAFL